MTFDFTQDYILENDIVTLKPLHITDVENLLTYSLNEPETWEYSLMKVSGKENLIKYIERPVKERLKGKSYAFIVFDKRTQQYCGSTRFYDVDLKNKTLSLGFTWYGKAFRGTGLNKNCKYLLLDFAFNKMQMERVEFRADDTNRLSINAMKSIGCTVEGTLRGNFIRPDGTRRNSIVLSILKDEWFNNKKEALFNKL